LLLKTDYSGNYLYVNDELQIIFHEYGRLVAPSFSNLISNTATREANSLEGYTASQDVTLTSEYLNGETYVKVVSNQSTSTPGVWPIGGTIAVKKDERYAFKVLGYRETSHNVHLYVWGNNGDIIWTGELLPQGQANETWITSEFTVPAGVTQIKVGVLWSSPAVGATFYINRVALYKLDWEYQYFLTDHLGSPRIVLQTEPHTFTYTATMESENFDKESQQFLNLNSSYEIVFGAANATPGGNEALKMNANYRVGPSRSFKVFPGDVVDASVMAYYSPGTYSKTSLATMAAYVISALTGGGTQIADGINYSYTGSGGNPAFTLSPDQGSTKPSAFLNYILFDETFTPLEAKSAPLGGTVGQLHPVVLPTITIKEPGILFVYLSYDNDTGGDVFFDDLKITYQESPVIQINDYYPYGLPSFVWLREGEAENKYQFQGKELDEKTGWYDFHARQYDGALGRWFAPDPANQFTNPYMALINNPITHTDPDGRIVPLLVVVGAAVIGGGINLATNWKNVDNFWQGLGYFGAGAASGALSTLGPAGWAAGGLITGASNAALGGGDLGTVIQSGVVGAFSGLVGGYAGQLGGQLGGVAVNGLRINSPILSGAITGALGGSLGGFAGGATGGFLTGQDPWQAGINGAITGAAIGGGVGAGAAGIQAHRQRINPFTGKPYSGETSLNYDLIDAGLAEYKRREIIDSFVEGTIERQLADEGSYGLRFYGGRAQPEGGFLFPTFDNLTNRYNLALPNEWNYMTGIRQWQITPGKYYYQGITAPQFRYGPYYIGGSRQIYTLPGNIKLPPKL
jgi:RHS repeat-associated protein